ncbi:hypothetical protein O6H91_14G028200 [Diphasiastrum complanatum]|uniref:Uncharacterized protein n=1 Tax=Diphasiastrum complanatum TaxID=34168 RepID=A0ACC2BMM0_DIPCM|nr:hypothetical protein O6H91_14G028200 [Diphasiastrum complanatum]
MAVASSLAPGLSRKLKKVLETRTDSPDLLASLSTLSDFYQDNTLQARRNLRATIEKRGLSINDEFLSASETAQKALDAVELEVSGLVECCERIAKSLSSCSSTTKDIVTAIERLRLELESTTQRQDLVATFLHNFQLSQEEVNALREEDLSENFFKALARVQEIHANCKVLLRTHHQRAGLELMDMMAVYQEGAYERLCRWVQAECRNLGDNDTPEVNGLLKTAARCLKERPVLFKYCAEEVANMRHNSLFRRFISALTRGGPGGMPRPIEVHAHDPLRYVGDMLAWLHQALASECELSTALFSSDAVAITTSRRFFRDSDRDEGKSETDMTFVLDRVFEGVCRPFKVRVEQVLQSQPGLQLAYKLSNLFEFYSHTICDILGENAALSVTVRDARDAALRKFFDIMKARGDKLLRYLPPVTMDLSPPPAVGEGVSVLLELMNIYDSMMVPAGCKKPDFDPIVAAILDPLIQMCERMAENYGVKSPVPVHRASGVSLESGRRSSNVATTLRKTTSVESILSGNGHSGSSQNSIEAHMAAIVDQEVMVILEKCNLQKKISCIKTHCVKEAHSHVLSKDKGIDDGKRISDLEDMSPSAVSESLKLMFALLAGNEGRLPEFEQLQVPLLRSEACGRVANALADAYELIYNTVLDPASGYEEPKVMLRHAPDQMRTIVGI